MTDSLAHRAPHGGDMRFRALAADYDGTLAEQGRVASATIHALERFRAAGGALVLVTGRTVAQLQDDFDRDDLFDRVIAENGAVVYRPNEGSERILAAPPSPAFVAALRARNVEPLTVGRSIIATSRPNEAIVRATIRDLGLELDVIFNKGAIMVLPARVNKASGLLAALQELGVLPAETVAVGDAENDGDFLALAGLSVAVANALPSLKQRADVTTDGEDGVGIVELVDGLVRGRWASPRRGLAAS